MDAVAVNSGFPVQGTRKWMYMFFMQNDFKVTPELTVNLGLRYELYGVNREVRDRYRVFDAWECKGFCPMGTQWYKPDHNNFDPRVGIAWAPKALKGKTVIRTGGGIYHGPGQVDDVNTPLDNYISNYSLTRNEAPALSYPIAPYLGHGKGSRDYTALHAARPQRPVQRQLGLLHPAAACRRLHDPGSLQRQRGQEVCSRVWTSTAWTW